MKKISNHQTPHWMSSQGRDDTPGVKVRLNTQELFGIHNEIIIEHQGDDYRLRITSNGKLLLTK